MHAKLRVSQPGDVYEQKADRVAHQAMSGLRLHRKDSHQPGAARGGSGERFVQGLGPGAVLEQPARGFMEARLGHDFSNVRIHKGVRAAASAEAMDALAYTAGRHVVFGPHQFQPYSGAGQRLLAHELAHVAQAEPATVFRKEKKKKSPAKPKKPAVEEPEATEPTASAVKAVEQARKMKGQTDPAIWFDSWGNDLRDNDLNGKVDDKKEQGLSDGSHHKGSHDAMVCKDPGDTVDKCPAADQSKIKVNYKVCIDVPIESYLAAGASISKNRWIPTFFGQLRKNPDWRVWRKPDAPSNSLAGDIVAAANADHQHAGIVEKGLLGSDWVINLPGPTAARKYKMFRPSGRNDLVSVPRKLFEVFLGIDWVARPKK